ncbi:hypothetical protein MKZ38_007559 [Zalerion maritima]|uniref:Uncharacterized protein n=1 Tax=Zalerion maritima TaxID=339359 RepID=A0AAD5WP15_9PEZI|nr:hypothetical protein MKZ38_007559 [Zalerion maritima]
MSDSQPPVIRKSVATSTSLATITLQQQQSGSQRPSQRTSSCISGPATLVQNNSLSASSPPSITRSNTNLAVTASIYKAEIFYDHVTRNVSLISLTTSILLAVACFSVGGYVLYTTAPDIYGPLPLLNLPAIFPSLITFLIHLFVTFLLSALGHIHSVSLRWALHREGRLEFNSNPRLFTTAGTDPSFSCGAGRAGRAVHSLYANTAWLFFTTLKYASSSFIVVQWADWQDEIQEKGYPTAFVNVVALFGLGSSILMLSVLAGLCLWKRSRGGAQKQEHIPTWNSNTLGTTLACLQNLHPDSSLAHHPGRAMLPVSQINSVPSPTVPVKVQDSMRNTRTGLANGAMGMVWGTVILACAWLLGMILCSKYDERYDATGGKGWSFVLSWYGISEDDEDDDSNIITADIDFLPPVQATAALFGLFLEFLVCLPQTLVFCMMEVLVGITTDEKTWRKGYVDKVKSSLPSSNPSSDTIRGISLNTPSIINSLSSPQTLTLFVMKPIMYWLLSQSFFLARDPTSRDHASISITVTIVRIIPYAAGNAVLAFWATYMACRRPSGLQPAAWGHVQTLANLVDDWDVGSDGQMFWGDKGVYSGHAQLPGTEDEGYHPGSTGGTEYRHAGTGNVRLAPIDPGAKYL